MKLRDSCVRTAVWLLVLGSLVECKKRRTKRGNGKCSTDSLVEYNLSFFGDWSKENFPRMYPKYRPHAQWSKLYGMTHGPIYKLWSEGEVASPAVKKFAEERSTLILEKQAQGYNATYDIFTAAPIRGGLGRTSVRIFADGRHSKLSFLVKIIPSPDWFVGVNGLDLCRNGRWRRKVYAHLRPMDAGTDKGLTYTSPNWPAHPQQKIFEITPSYPDHPASSFFYPDRSRLPRIAHAIIERVSEYQQRGRVTAVRYNSMPNTEVIRQEHELMGAKSSSSMTGGDEEEIPLNTNIDDALVEKLENDIQRNLKTAPRQTFFLQRMLKTGGKPLADQSSEEEEEEEEVRSAASYLAQKVSIRQTTLYEPPPTTTTTFAPIQKRLNRWTDFDADRNEKYSMEAVKARLVLEPSHIMPDMDTGVDNGVENSKDSTNAQGRESSQSNHLPARNMYRSYHNATDTLDSQENISDNSRYEVTTWAPVEKQSVPAPDNNYGAAYSASSARTVDTTEVYQQSELQSRVGQTEKENDDVGRDEFYKGNDQHSSQNVNNNQNVPRINDNDRDRRVDSNDNLKPDRSSYDNGGDDVYLGRDNVDVETAEADKLSSLGIFDELPVSRKTDSDEQLDCLIGEWTPWSSCSKTCGFGVRTRSREVLQHSQNGGLNCPRLSAEVLCGSMRTCKWNYFNSMFSKYTDPKRRRRRRRRRHHRT